MNLPDEKREVLAEALAKAARMPHTLACPCGPFALCECPARERAYEAADAVAPLLADWLAEAEARGRAEVVAGVEALADEWEAAAAKPMPTKAEGETERDQGVRIGVWHSVKHAARELRDALADRGALDRVRAEALREAADAWETDASDPTPRMGSRVNDWLRDHADRIERDGGA